MIIIILFFLLFGPTVSPFQSQNLKKKMVDFLEFKSLDSPRNPSVWVSNFSPKRWNVFGGYGAQIFSDLGWRIQVLIFLRNNSIHDSIHDSDESGDLHHTGRIWVVASMFNCNISVEENNDTLFASISNDDAENANGPQISLVRCGCSSIWRNVPLCQPHLSFKLFKLLYCWWQPEILLTSWGW